MLAIGYHSASVRLLAAQDHVTAGLPAKNKSGAFKCFAHFTAGQVGRKFSHERLRLGGFDFNDFFPCFGRNWITRRTTIINIELDRLTDIGQRILSTIALTNATR